MRTVSREEIEIKKAFQSRRVDGSVRMSSAEQMLKDWGNYKRNEIDIEAGLKPPITNTVRSGDALEELPEAPRQTITEEEAQTIGLLIAMLKPYHQHCIRQKYFNGSEAQLKRKHFKAHARDALEAFARLV